MGHKADHDLHLVPRSKNAWSDTSTPPIRLHGVVFNLAQRQVYILPFAFYLYEYLCLFLQNSLNRKIFQTPVSELCDIVVISHHTRTSYRWIIIRKNSQISFSGSCK